MKTSLNETPASSRTHITFLGRMNSGKSALVNAFAGHAVSIVDGAAGTTTDPVRKSMEIHGIGPCVLIDTAGFDDAGDLGQKRVETTRQVAQETDLAVILFTQENLEEEANWFRLFAHQDTPVVAVVSKCDANPDTEALCAAIRRELDTDPITTSAVTGQGVDALRERLVELSHRTEGKRFITGNLVGENDLVLLVMPQVIQSPEGRLILPQVQTIRELLDKKCLVMSCTTDKLDQTLSALAYPPKLIITDSQVFRLVYDKKPKESLLTSFSTLFAAYKGDIHAYVQGAKAIDGLRETDKVLIAEACTHAPMEEDIGRVKIPRLLRQRTGPGLTVDVVSGKDFPADLRQYALIIQCGACMFNRKYVLSRVAEAKAAGVPMTNYGVAIAHLSGILADVAIPE
ncbi:MAG: [FeFe] hydrogenase H-cluster maturation GTPase HydF [Clostridiales bacterium]|nr:[FeFe] hydrogenase H-cluster maturation GTPase HydF [Clostridiales bacterium]